ncbi:MAG TPA: PASTA domain-containing protein [Gaiellaceae bacterium]|nr:PASTA domain-containing protein [Gaiellaceae bacterium]
MLRLSSRSAAALAALVTLAVLVIGGTAGSAAVSGTDVTYTLDGDFDKGTLVNVNHDAPKNNQIQLNERTSTFPFIWVALSAKGTIAKIDTRDGTILGEYSTTSDDDGAHNPSRTTVTLDGSAWAGNRNQSSAIHVGLKELNQCIDRNGNGTIDTSSGYGDVKPWPGGSSGSSSPVSQAQDECILHYVDTQGGDARHVSVTPTGQVWIGSYGGSHYFHLIDNGTGAILRTEGPFNCGGYGGLVDGNGIVWSATSGSSVLRWDPALPVSVDNPKCLPINNYGMAIDGNGNIWVSTLGEGVVRKVAPDGTVLGTFSQGQAYAQGLAVDGNGDVWISSSLFSGTQVSHLKNDGTFVGSVQLTFSSVTSNGPTGIAVDAAGKIWSANINSSDATRIDPNGGDIGADGVTRIGAVDLRVNLPDAYPYNYSDMTGAALLRSTSPQGSWNVVQDGGAAGRAWGTIRWNTEAQGSVPAGASITVEVRASDSEAGLGGQSFAAVSNDTAFSVTGRFLEVRVTLRPNQQGESPVLSDLRICAVGACQAVTPPTTTPPPPPPAATPRAPRVVRRCTVPNVKGKTVAQARRAISRAGCRAVVMGRRYSASAAAGRVLGQSIRAGRRVRRGTIVRLLISRGAQPIRPPFTG